MSVRFPSLPAPRMFVHQDLILFATHATLATANWACKWFFLSKNDSWVGKIPHVIAGVFGWYACEYALQAAKFYMKRRYLMAPPIHPTVNNNEASFEKAFARIKKLPANNLNLIFDPQDSKTATESGRKNFFKDNLSYGTCLGEAAVLSKLASKKPTASCQDLLKSLNEESQITEIFYLQMMELMVSRMESFKEAFIKLSGDYSHSSEMRQSAQSLSQTYVELILKIKNVLEPGGSSSSSTFAITQPSCFYHEELKALVDSRNLPAGQPFLGCVHIETTATFANGQFIAGHAIFFQYSDGCYRFYDPYSPADGFYEYKDKNIFIEYLRPQLIEDVGNIAKVRFST